MKKFHSLILSLYLLMLLPPALHAFECLEERYWDDSEIILSEFENKASYIDFMSSVAAKYANIHGEPYWGKVTIYDIRDACREKNGEILFELNAGTSPVVKKSSVSTFFGTPVFHFDPNDKNPEHVIKLDIPSRPEAHIKDKSFNEYYIYTNHSTHGIPVRMLEYQHGGMEIYDVKKKTFLDKLDKDQDLDYFFTLYYEPTDIFLCSSYHSAEEKEEYFTKYYGDRDYKTEDINDDGFMDIRIIRIHLRCNLNSENDFPNEEVTEIVDIVAAENGFKRLPSKWIGKTDNHPQ